MEKSNLSLIIACIALALFMVFTAPGHPAIACDPPASECGPLMGNAAGTKFCCNNTNQNCCYAASCSGGEQQ